MPLAPRPVRRAWQRLVRRALWRMDVHPSATIAPTALIDRTWPKGVHIGAGVTIDEEAVVLTHDLTRGLYLDTFIEEGATLGPRAIVLPGVRVGASATVQPGAVVVRDVEAGQTVGGNPARPLRDDTSQA